MDRLREPTLSPANPPPCPPPCAILLVNLGTPDAPSSAAVRRYLAEFLWDPRVIEAPRWLWWLVLYGVILRIRPARSAKAYREVWTAAGSPLLVLTRRLAERVATLFTAAPNSGNCDPPVVRVAMRYGRPSIPAVLRELRAQGIERLVVLPLYPQYSATTTASVFDALSAEFSGWRRLPELRMIMEYHDDHRYLAALADGVRAHWATHGRAQRLLISFHGLPQRYVDGGDPYYRQCRRTAERLAAALELTDADWTLAFQSRVGREAWLKPYTESLLQELPQQGVRSLQVLCPGFAVDCLETLEEILIRGKATFLAAGGERYEYIAALNDNVAHATALAGVVRDRISDWTTAVERTAESQQQASPAADRMP